ncbi:MAG TPA: DNA recombination protein RmuC [Puia sp.]|jgi:DNA recombination protein RmuC
MTTNTLTLSLIIWLITLLIGIIIGWLVAKGRLSSRIATLLANSDNLGQQLAQVIKEKDLLSSTLDTVKEAHAISRTKYEELSLGNIEVTNERNRLKGQVEQLKTDLMETNIALTGKNNSLEAKYAQSLLAIEEQKKFVSEAQKALKDSFDALSAAALDKNNQSFLDLAKTALETHVTQAKGDLEQRKQAIDNLVKPLGESLSKMDEKINSLETKREGAYSQMSTLLDQMKMSTTALDKETKNLVTALKTSHTRGRYGEIALRRLVEFAGMMDQCDFEEQVTTEGEGGKLRPDMIIHLPGNRSVVVDSKVPLSAYLQIFETEDHEQQKIYLNQHIAAVRSHIKQLSAKAYWDQFSEAPDFVVLFMQIESSFGAALQGWPGLIEEALNNRIIVATPTTLITILRSIGYSWNQLKTVESIESIRDAAVDLYERSAILMEHLVNIGKGLTGTVNHYNKAVGSLESTFLPQGRKIQQLSQAYIKRQLTDVVPIEVSLRPVLAIPPQVDKENGD